MEGHQVESAYDGTQGWKQFVNRSHHWDVIITDLVMPRFSGIELLAKLRIENFSIPVIICSGQTSGEYVLHALQEGAFDYIKKPFSQKELFSALRRLELTIIPHADLRATLSECHETTKFSITSRCRHLGSVIKRFQFAFQPILQAHRINTDHIKLCLEEAIVNAIVHGNLEVPSSLKEESWDRFDRIIEERENNPTFVNRLVHVTYELDREKLCITVEDEGRGFDYRSVIEEEDPLQLMLSGRGIMLIRSFMDEVIWNESGNCIHMTKYLHPEESLPLETSANGE